MLEIGRIGRPHGLRGEMSVRLVSNRPERLAPGSKLETDSGTLEVLSARVHGNRCIVAFAHVGSREEAASLRGLVLRATPLDDPSELWVHDLIGATVVDQSGVHRGTVHRILANPACDLLELACGALVPVRFVTACIPNDVVEVEVPEGLFEVNQ